MAAGRGIEPARDGRASQSQRRLCCVLGKRETIAERDRDQALLEIHSELKLKLRYS